MRQVSLGLLVILCFCFPIPVTAQAPTDNYIRQLVELGYDDIKISKTFLGRYRILADRDGITRELVVARNGQLLFDYLNAAEREPSIVLKKTEEEGNPPPNSNDTGRGQSGNTVETVAPPETTVNQATPFPNVPSTIPNR